MKAVVLAAGKGVRLWPLTETRPKPLLPIANKAIVAQTLEAIVEAGIRQIVLVIGFKGDMIRQKIGDGKSLGCEIQYVEQKAPRGTADALATAANELKAEDRFLVAYGDDFYQKKAVKNFVAEALKNEGIAIATLRVEDPSQFGVVESRRGKVTGIREKPPRKEAGQVNSGLYLMTNSVLSSVKGTKRSKRGEFELTDSLKMLIDRGENVRSLILEDKGWMGISYPWDLLEANQRVLAAKSPQQDGRIEEGVRVEGPIMLEEGSVVKGGSRLEGPVLIGKGCEIGPSAYLRPFTSLGDDVKVGAACEVKNSIVMANSRIPHLSYVGDSILGEGCSLGAGTITANLRFDEALIKSRVNRSLLSSGRRKLGAILGDGVRTGINVSVFPGVKIGARSWIGPGAIVERDAPSETRFKA